MVSGVYVCVWLCVCVCVHMVCEDTLWSGGTDPEIWLEMVAAMSCLHHSTWELDGLSGKTMKKNKKMYLLILIHSVAHQFE